MIQQRRLFLAECSERLHRLLQQKLVSAKHQMALYIEELKGLSPLYKLQGGYSYVADMEGNNIRSAKMLEKGQKLNLSMTDGSAVVTVDEVKISGPGGFAHESATGK